MTKIIVTPGPQTLTLGPCFFSDLFSLCPLWLIVRS